MIENDISQIFCILKLCSLINGTPFSTDYPENMEREYIKEYAMKRRSTPRDNYSCTIINLIRRMYTYY